MRRERAASPCPFARLRWLPLAGVLSLLPSYAAAATVCDELEDETGEVDCGPAPSPLWRVSLGGHLALSLTDVAETDIDVVAISPILLAGAHLAGRFQVAPTWTLGARAAFGTEPGQRGQGGSEGARELERQLWQLAAEARYQPLGAKSYWLAAEIGAAAMIDSIEGTGVNDSVVQWAPLAGASLGFDFPVVEQLTVGFGIRAEWLLFGDGAPLEGKGIIEYGSLAFAGVGVELSYWL